MGQRMIDRVVVPITVYRQDGLAQHRHFFRKSSDEGCKHDATRVFRRFYESRVRVKRENYPGRIRGSSCRERLAKPDDCSRHSLIRVSIIGLGSVAEGQHAVLASNEVKRGEDDALLDPTCVLDVRGKGTE